MPLEILDIALKLPLPKGLPLALPITRLEEITIHRTDSDISTPVSTARYHTSPPPDGRGWSRIAYHYYVAKNGAVFQTLDARWEGCHAPPNYHRLGVCFVGRCSSPLTEEQHLVLPELLDMLTAKFVILRKNVRGHREAMPGHTDCPGDDMAAALVIWKDRPTPPLPTP